MTPREAAERRLVAEFIRVSGLAPVVDDSPMAFILRDCAKLAAEAIDAALDEHHCGCCDGGWDGSEERRVGKECNGQCRSRWSPYH